MREAVVHRADEHHSAARVAYRDLAVFIPFEEEQPRIAFRRISRLFRVRVYVAEDFIARLGVRFHIVCDLHGLVRVDMAVPRQIEVAERRSAVITLVYRKNQSSVVAERGIGYNVVDLCVHRERLACFCCAFSIPEKQRQSVIQIFLHSIKVVITAVLLVKDVVIRRKYIAR